MSGDRKKQEERERGKMKARLLRTAESSMSRHISQSEYHS
jgi:hypothetical protein